MQKNDNELRWAAAQQYMTVLRHGDPNAVANVPLLRSALAAIGKTLGDLETDEEEIALCVLVGRKLTALSFLQYLETGRLTDEAVKHFFTESLRYGTQNYGEVVGFIRDLVEELTIPIKRIDIQSENFERLIRDCYCVVARLLLIHMRQSNDLSVLNQFYRVVAEGELSLEYDVGITDERLDDERRRIHNLWLNRAREAFAHLRSSAENFQTVVAARGDLREITLAQRRGNVTEPEFGAQKQQLRLFETQLELYGQLRGNARNN